MAGLKGCCWFSNLTACQSYLESWFDLYVLGFIAEIIILWVWEKVLESVSCKCSV